MEEYEQCGSPVRVHCEQWARVAADEFVGAGRPSPTPGLLDAINPTATARFVALGGPTARLQRLQDRCTLYGFRARVRCRDSQSTFIFPFEHEDGHLTFIWMADRWNANGPGKDPYAQFSYPYSQFRRAMIRILYPCSPLEHPYSHLFSRPVAWLVPLSPTNTLPDKLGCRRPRQHDIRVAAARPAPRTIAVEALGRLEAAARGM